MGFSLDGSENPGVSGSGPGESCFCVSSLSLSLSLSLIAPLWRRAGETSSFLSHSDSGLGDESSNPSLKPLRFPLRTRESAGGASFTSKPWFPLPFLRPTYYGWCWRCRTSDKTKGAFNYPARIKLRNSSQGFDASFTCKSAEVIRETWAFEVYFRRIQGTCAYDTQTDRFMNELSRHYLVLL